MHQTQTPSAPQLADIYGMWHIPFWQSGWFKICCAAGSLMILGILAYVGWRIASRRRAPRLSPWQEALVQLEQMGTTLPKSSDETRLYYLRLTWVLKHYLQRRYNCVLAGSTDTELAAEALSHGAPEQVADQLKEVLEGAVLIKFARAEARQTQITRDLKHARTIVALTTPAPAPSQSRDTNKA